MRPCGLNPTARDNSVRGQMTAFVLNRLLQAGLLIGWTGFSCAALPETIAEPQLAASTLEGSPARPFQLERHKAALLLFVTHDCPISNSYAREYARIRGEYADKQVSTWLIYVDPDAKTADLKQHQQVFGLTGFPAIHDRQHVVVKAAGATMTPEAVIVSKDGLIAYRGRVDNLYADYGKRRRQPTVRDLRDALDALLSGRPVAKARTEAIGCFIPPLPQE